MPQITGYIKQGDLTVPFVGDNYHFLFLPAAVDKSAYEFGIQGLTSGNTFAKIQSEHGFIHGYTYDGNPVLIYCPGEVWCRPVGTLNTWLYIVFKGIKIPETVNGIEFVGGSLNSVFQQKSIIMHSEEISGPNVDIHNDKKIIHINSKKIESLELHSAVHADQSRLRGVRLQNTGSILDMIFSNEQPIDAKVFSTNYDDILTMIEFMTFRKNVFFESVHLIQNNEYDGQIVHENVADCYIKNDFYDADQDIEECYENVRYDFRCITFDYLSENEAGSLFRIIESRNSKQSEYSVDFIPGSKRDVAWITKQQIRDICTSIELEAHLSGIKAEHEKEFDDLIKKLKSVVNESQTNDHSLSERDYNYILGNINFMVAPAAELAKKLFDEYKDTVSPIMKLCNIDDLSEDDIQGVIKIRNNLTHRGNTDFAKKDLDTASVLMGVVYSSVLSRCGCPHEKILNIIESGLLTVSD